MSESSLAAVLVEYGRPPEYTSAEIPPQPGEGQLLIDVEAAGLNPVDVALAEQRYVVPPPPVPYVPGIEAVGRVVASAADGLMAGDRVYSGVPVVPHGTFAARTLAYPRRRSRSRTPPIPASRARSESRGWPRTGRSSTGPRCSRESTSWYWARPASSARSPCQAARLLGADTIVAVGRDPERLEATRELGATATARIGEDDLEAVIREATGGGANVVVDMLCGPPAEAALAAMAIGGRLVQLGRSAAETMEVASATVRGRTLSIIGHTNMLMPPEERRSAYEWLLEQAIAGALRVDVETVPLADVADAWNRQKSSPGHKLVLAP